MVFMKNGKRNKRGISIPASGKEYKSALNHSTLIKAINAGGSVAPKPYSQQALHNLLYKYNHIRQYVDTERRQSA